MVTRIYWAAPLHGEKERLQNVLQVQKLRDAGFKVYLPQEHGIWEDMVKDEMEKSGISERDAIAIVRIHLYKADKEAVEKCDIVIAQGTHEDGSPSEGMIWEMGYAAGLHKPVFLINPEDNHWDYNLMPEFGARMTSSLEKVIAYLRDEEFS